MRWPWSTPGVEPGRITVHTDWCVHENGKWPSYDWCQRNSWSLRHLRFHNALNCVRFDLEHHLTWEWPPR